MSRRNRCQGVAVAKRRSTHHLLDLERCVPFLKLLMLKEESATRRAAGANQRVLIDEQIEHRRRHAAAVICPGFHEAIFHLLNDEARPIVYDIAVLAVRVASTASAINTSA